MDDKQSRILAINEELAPRLIDDDAKNLKPIQKKFMESYLKQHDKVSVEEWLPTEIRLFLPNYSSEEINSMSKSIITTIDLQDKKKASLKRATSIGRSRESWFTSEVKKATSEMTVVETTKYLESLDNAVNNANQSLYRTVQTQSGLISQNPNLDGFIAEQYQVQTFNMNAAAKGSPYRAEVLEPQGHGYGKNSVDIKIVDADSKIVNRYQVKYCKDPKATLQALKNGDYRGQQALVPMDQKDEINKKVSDVLRAPDGTTSNPLTKDQAKQIQLEVQSKSEARSGNLDSIVDWNDYQMKDLSIGIGKQAGKAALLGASVSVGYEIAQKAWQGESIEGAELADTALKTGTDIGVKAAMAGALKVGSEKELITCIPKGTPTSQIADVVYVGVEDAKVVQKIATGELTLKEGTTEIQTTTVSAVAGLAASVKGTEVGAAIGTVLGPVGAAVGGFVGGTVGYMAGSKVGKAVSQGAHAVRRATAKGIQKLGEGIKDTFHAFNNFMKNGLSNLFS